MHDSAKRSAVLRKKFRIAVGVANRAANRRKIGRQARRPEMAEQADAVLLASDPINNNRAAVFASNPK
ncbi:MAG: hypothetical protein ACUVQK_04720 [Thermogutta sp.]